jgi:polyisoprenoid-binding protein YceI
MNRTSRLVAVVAVAAVFLISFLWLSATRISRVSALKAFQGKTLSIVPSESKVTVAVGKAGLLSTLAHDHTISARTFSGKIQLAGSDKKNGSIEVEIEAASLRVADQGITEADRSEIQKAMETEVLNVSQFPKISFKSTVTKGDGQNVSVEGDLTLHGVTRRSPCRSRSRLPETVAGHGKVALKQTTLASSHTQRAGSRSKSKTRSS